jgi:hypothetical protein
VPEGFFELVFEDEDPAGSVEGGAVLHHLAGSCGQAQLVAGVADEGPGAPAPGPGVYGSKNTIYRQVRRVVVSTPTAISGVGCEDRVSVTEDHLSFDGNCGVRPA